MGIRTSAVLIVGLPHDEIIETPGIITALEVDGKDFYEVCEDIGIYSASPYYDASEDDRIWGVVVEGEGEVDIALLHQKILDAQETFERLTGAEGRLFVSPNVT
jgi:hypothetical protein